ncbi:MAG: hypothetical protein HYW01_01135 [Deltaproteobacteria bacterium]|nr:hypothetical protein [Deltaproteobacteria bacterium]
MEYVRSGAHREAMIGMRRHLSETKFVKWKISGSSIPPAWGESLKRL